MDNVLKVKKGMFNVQVDSYQATPLGSAQNLINSYLPTINTINNIHPFAFGLRTYNSTRSESMDKSLKSGFNTILKLIIQLWLFGLFLHFGFAEVGGSRVEQEVRAPGARHLS